jgi:flagellar motor component MotA
MALVRVTSVAVIWKGTAKVGAVIKPGEVVVVVGAVVSAAAVVAAVVVVVAVVSAGRAVVSDAPFPQPAPSRGTTATSPIIRRFGDIAG